MPSPPVEPTGLAAAAAAAERLTSPDTPPADAAPREDLQPARPIDLMSMRLVLEQHLDELRRRGVAEADLAPIVAQLDAYAVSIDELARSLGLPVPGRTRKHRAEG